jgi:hypothetical protein
LAGKAELDEVYLASKPWYAEDKATFERRLAQGFPVDFEPIWS